MAVAKLDAWNGEKRPAIYGPITVAEATTSLFRELPTASTAAKRVTERPIKISPYSIAVAPDSLDKKSTSNFRMIDPV